MTELRARGIIEPTDHDMEGNSSVKVILTADVTSLGKSGDLKDVAERLRPQLPHPAQAGRAGGGWRLPRLAA